MLLTEIFDKPTKWKWVHQGDYEASASFDIKSDDPDSPSLKYFVLFHMEWSGNDWSIDFGYKDPETGKINFLDETRDFQSFSIFATIKSILEEFIKKYQPSSFLFQSNTKLTNLYIRAFNHLMPNAQIKKDNLKYKVVLNVAN